MIDENEKKYVESYKKLYFNKSNVDTIRTILEEKRKYLNISSLRGEEILSIVNNDIEAVIKFIKLISETINENQFFSDSEFEEIIEYGVERGFTKEEVLNIFEIEDNKKTELLIESLQKKKKEKGIIEYSDVEIISVSNFEIRISNEYVPIQMLHKFYFDFHNKVIELLRNFIETDYKLLSKQYVLSQYVKEFNCFFEMHINKWRSFGMVENDIHVKKMANDLKNEESLLRFINDINEINENAKTAKIEMELYVNSNSSNKSAMFVGNLNSMAFFYGIEAVGSILGKFKSNYKLHKIIDEIDKQAQELVNQCITKYISKYLGNTIIIINNLYSQYSTIEDLVKAYDDYNYRVKIDKIETNELIDLISSFPYSHQGYILIADRISSRTERIEFLNIVQKFISNEVVSFCDEKKQLIDSLSIIINRVKYEKQLEYKEKTNAYREELSKIKLDNPNYSIYFKEVGIDNIYNRYEDLSIKTKGKIEYELFSTYFDKESVILKNASSKLYHNCITHMLEIKSIGYKCNDEELDYIMKFYHINDIQKIEYIKDLYHDTSLIQNNCSNSSGVKIDTLMINLENVAEQTTEKTEESENESYKEKESSPEDYATFEIEKLVTLSQNGDSYAQAQLGFNYSKGHKTEVNISEAIRWYERASESNELLALYNLAIIYKNNDVHMNKIRAFELLRRYYDIDNTGKECIFSLALCYHYGDGVGCNYSKAIELFNESYKLGCLDSLKWIGYYHMFGYLGKQNFEESLRIFEKVSAQIVTIEERNKIETVILYLKVKIGLCKENKQDILYKLNYNCAEKINRIINQKNEKIIRNKVSLMLDNNYSTISKGFLSYARNLEFDFKQVNEFPIFIWDDTLLGSGKCGFGITHRFLYIQNKNDNPIRVPINTISKISGVRKQIIINDKYVIKINHMNEASVESFNLMFENIIESIKCLHYIVETDFADIIFDDIFYVSLLKGTF